jgi:hypothetical protein
VTEPFSAGLCDDRFVVLGVRDSAEALRSLRAYGRERGSLQAPDEYQTFEIFEFLSPSVLEPFAGPGCSFQHPVCAMIGGYVVFADNRPGLELWIDKYIVNQTLTNRTDVLQLLGQRGGRGLGWLYLNTAYLPALFKHLVPESVQSRPSADLPALARLGLWGFDLQDGPGRQLRARPAVQPTAAAASAQTSILWKTPLAAGAITAPYVVGPPGENARVSVLIQDEQFQLYCLDAEGEVRWRRQLPSRLLSAVHGIDYLGNQSVGYLFNTAESIWLLDEAGNDLEGFPLQLQSEATNGVTVVDFDGNAQFSFFIACANGNVYGYDQFGRPLPGWNPQPGQGRVDHPLLHFQRGGKDYLVALNRAGRLSAFGRTGERRFPAVAWGGKFPGPPQVDTGRLSPRIVAFDAGGVAHICNLSGQTFSVKIGAGRDGPALGVFAPLVGDARYEFAVLENDRIKALGYSGDGLKPVFNRTLPARQDTVFAAPGQRLGTLSRAKRQVLLLDGRGHTVAGFPLAGSTPFALSDRLRKNREDILLVGYGANLYAYVVR